MIFELHLCQCAHPHTARFSTLLAEVFRGDNPEDDNQALQLGFELAIKERDAALKERDAALKECDVALQEREGALREQARAWQELAETRRQLESPEKPALGLVGLVNLCVCFCVCFF